jgi:hypothetical protein
MASASGLQLSDAVRCCEGLRGCGFGFGGDGLRGTLVCTANNMVYVIGLVLEVGTCSQDQ